MSTINNKEIERIGYLVNKQGKWFLNTESGQNTFTNEFSALYYATRYNIKVIHDKPRNQSV